jgi:uncharacterized protein (TIGR03086 family)
MIDLQPATDQVARLVDGVTDDQFADPTPCEGVPVGALLDHLMSLTLAFTRAARKNGGSAPPPEASAANLPPDWRTVLPQRLRELAEAWADPAAWQGSTQAGGLTMPGGIAGVVALDEVVLHGWDLAKATGQQYTADPASAAAVLEFTRSSAQPENAPMRQGLFGPVVAVPEDAPVFDRALGYAGRDPGWTP